MDYNLLDFTELKNSYTYIFDSFNTYNFQFKFYFNCFYLNFYNN